MADTVKNDTIPSESPRDTQKIADDKSTSIENKQDEVVGIAPVKDVENNKTSAEEDKEDDHEKGFNFTEIPYVPMKQILKYLSFDQKKEMRLVSKGTKRVVDKFDKKFQVWRLLLEKGFWKRNGSFIKGTNTDLNVVLMEPVSKSRLYLVKAFMPRAVRLTASISVFKYLDENKVDMKSVKVMAVMDYLNESKEMPWKMVLSSTTNLTILALDGVDLKTFPNLDPSTTLDKLKEVHIRASVVQAGLLKLLSAACSNGLDVLVIDSYSVYDNSHEIINFSTILKDDSKLNIKKLSLKNLPRPKRVLALVAAASESLEGLELINIFDQDINCRSEFRLPRLKNLSLDSCNGEFINLISSAAQNLMTIHLKNLEEPPCVMKPIDDSSTVVKIEIMGSWEPGYSSLLARYATSLETLILMYGNAVTDHDIKRFPVNFPKLKTVLAYFCGPKMAAEIGKRCPMIENFKMTDDFKEEILTESQWGKLKTLKFIQIAKELKVFNKFSWSLTCLEIGENLDFSQLEIRPITVKTLRVRGGGFISGFPKLLRACSESLEELEFCENTCVDLEDIDHPMKRLKTVTLDSYMVFQKNRHLNLLKYCANSLEKLYLYMPTSVSTSSAKVLFPGTGLDLPNLKIVQVSRKLNQPDFDHMKKVFPEDVIFWQFGRRDEDEMSVSDCCRMQ